MTVFSTREDLRVLTLPGVAPELCSAGLVLGVGRRDEDFVRGGVTHLLEHVVMHEVGRISGLDANAHVGLSTLEFVATGRPDRVAEFLRRVCEFLLDPPVERLSVEARILRAEEGGAGPGPFAFALGDRYGARDVGTAALAEPALLSITPDDVRGWVARHAVRGNAALWVVGDLPDAALGELAEALPPGDAPPRRPASTARVALPAWTDSPYDDVVAVTFESSVGAAEAAAAFILRRRVEDELRHRRGLTYEVGLDAVRIDDQRRHCGLGVTVPPEHAADAARTVVEQVRRLAADGPSEAELAHEIEDSRAYLTDPRNREDEAGAATEAIVRGWTVRDAATIATELDALTCAQVRQAAARMGDTLLLVVPEEKEVDVDGLTRLPNGSRHQVTGTGYRRRRLGGAPLGSRLVVGNDGVTLHLRGEGARTVLWSEVLGLVKEPDDAGRAGEAYQLVGVEGWTIPLLARDWRGGRDAVASVLRHVPEHLRVIADPDDAAPPHKN